MRFALVLALVFAVAAAPARAYKPTHRVSVTGQLVDRWTIDEPDQCGAVGGGTLTVDFKSRTGNRAQVGISPTHASESGGMGSWTLLVIGDSAGHITDMDAKPARGTIERRDETQLRPGPDGEPCDPPDRTGCGVQRLKKPFAWVAGYDRRHIRVDLERPLWDDLPCHHGSLGLFSSPPALAGGTREGELLLKMPRASKLRRKKVVRVSGSSHQRTTGGDPGATQVSDDVTRTATVTFTRLR